MSVGKLTIELLEANIRHDDDLFGKMDPYVVFKSREFTWKSEVCKKGGKKPQWHNQKFTIDVKYIGDDLEYTLWDDEIGKDEKIGDGEQKLSAFTAIKEWDEWFEVEHKGRKAGKIHLRSHWEPENAAHEDHDEMKELQELFKELAHKKKALEAEYATTKDILEHNAVEGAARLAAAESEFAGFDEAARVAEDDAAIQQLHQQITEVREKADLNLAEIQHKITSETQHLAERREQVGNSLSSQEAEALAVRDAALAKAEEDKVRHLEHHAAHRRQVEHEIEEEKRSDDNAFEKAKDEIKEVAEKLLAVNAQIQHHLEQLANL